MLQYTFTHTRIKIFLHTVTSLNHPQLHFFVYWIGMFFSPFGCLLYKFMNYVIRNRVGKSKSNKGNLPTLIPMGKIAFCFVYGSIFIKIFIFHKIGGLTYMRSGTSMPNSAIPFFKVLPTFCANTRRTTFSSSVSAPRIE